MCAATETIWRNQFKYQLVVSDFLLRNPATVDGNKKLNRRKNCRAKSNNFFLRCSRFCHAKVNSNLDCVIGKQIAIKQITEDVSCHGKSKLLGSWADWCDTTKDDAYITSTVLTHAASDSLLNAPIYHCRGIICVSLAHLRAGGTCSMLRLTFCAVRWTNSFITFNKPGRKRESDAFFWLPHFDREQRMNFKNWTLKSFFFHHFENNHKQFLWAGYGWGWCVS